MSEGAVNPPEANPGLGAFVHLLSTEGRAVVSKQGFFGNDAGAPSTGSGQAGPEHPEGARPEPVGGALMVLAGVEERARTELAGDAPAFSGPAGLWAARLIYQACCCVVCRELGADVLDKVFAVPCPTAPGPERDWSVDLLFRHLPELFRVARHLSNADPLLAALKALGTAWPLSSVGMPELEAVRIDSFCAHPALRRLYADRIVAAGDFSRIGDPRVADLLRADLGLHRELAPALAARLFPASADPTAAGPTSIGPSSS